MQYLLRAITISSFLFVNQAFSQHPQLLSEEGWELKKEKYDVQVFAKPIEGYKIKGFRASGFVAAKPETVYNVNRYQEIRRLVSRLQRRIFTPKG